MENSPFRLDNKVAVVAGAGSRAEGIGTGRAMSILFARAGARVLLVDRDRAAAEKTREMILAENPAATLDVFAADVTSADDCKHMVERAVEQWDGLDILINNVGILANGTILDTEPEQWDRAMEVNVKGMYLASRYAVPAMAETGGGSIVNISSTAALRPRGMTPYSVTKGAVITLTRALAVDHAAQGIRVNCIAPGPIFTPMVYAGGMSDDTREARRRSTLLEIEGTGWDIAYAALFLVSDEARFITGITLPVEGGTLVTRKLPPAMA